MKQKFDTEKFSLTPYQKKVEKPWGYEIIYTPEEAPAVGKIIHVNAGQRLSLQYHDEKIETLCLIDGKAVITLGDKNGETVEENMEIEKGYFMRPGQIHRVMAVSDITFIESSTPETGNTFRLQDDSGRPTETEEMRKDR